MKKQSAKKARKVAGKLRGAAENQAVPTTHDAHIAGHRGFSQGKGKGVPPNIAKREAFAPAAKKGKRIMGKRKK